MSIYAKLFNIQQKIKVGKNQINKFSGFKFRSAEDILSELKPFLNEEKCLILLTDTAELVGDYNYIKSVAKFIDIETGEIIETQADAREPKDKKGFDEPQITGTASSYARKYALNGMLALDDNKDVDSTDNRDKGVNKTAKPVQKKKVYTAEQIKTYTEHLTKLTLDKYKALKDEDKKKTNTMICAVMGKELSEAQIIKLLEKKSAPKPAEPVKTEPVKAEPVKEEPVQAVEEVKVEETNEADLMEFLDENGDLNIG